MVGKRAVKSRVYIEFMVARLPTLRHRRIGFRSLLFCFQLGVQNLFCGLIFVSNLFFD